MGNIQLEKIHEKIASVKDAVEELARMGKGFPALSRNTARILASLKMLEINISDLVEAEKPDV
jgi:hypothetical protein